MKRIDYHDSVALERANYAAMQDIVNLTPGMDLTMRPDVIMMSDPSLPMPDANHACLLRTTAEAAPALVDEIIEYFRSRDMPPTIYLSPQCSPPNLSNLLLTRGFVAQKEREAWLVFKGWESLHRPKPSPQVEVRAIPEEEVETFASVFVQAFELPAEYVPFLASVIRPSMRLDNIIHYVAFMEGEAVGVCTNLVYKNLSIFGSTGILKVRRGRRVLDTMICQLATDCMALGGLDVGLLQITAGGLFQRYMNIVGCETAFTRTCYVLP